MYVYDICICIWYSPWLATCGQIWLFGQSVHNKRHERQKCKSVSSTRGEVPRLRGSVTTGEKHIILFSTSQINRKRKVRKKGRSPALSIVKCFMDGCIFAALQIHLHIINQNSLILNIYAQLVTRPKKQLWYIMSTESIKPLKFGSLTQDTVSMHS